MLRVYPNKLDETCSDFEPGEVVFVWVVERPPLWTSGHPLSVGRRPDRRAQSWLAKRFRQRGGAGRAQHIGAGLQIR